jgi:hypothetical protein
VIPKNPTASSSPKPVIARAASRLDGAAAAGQANQSPPRKTKQRRIKVKTMVLVLVAAMLLVDVLAVGFLLLGRSPAQPDNQVEAHSNPVELIQGQLDSNHGKVIDTITYHPGLTFASYQITRDSVILTPLSNNYLASVGTGEERRVVLIDETAISRLLAFNSDWVAYLNSDSPAVFDNVLADSQVEEFIYSLKGFKVAFHRLAIGEISSHGEQVYVLAQPQYTLIKEGRVATVNDVCLFVFVKSGDTLKLSSIESLEQPSPADGDSTQTGGE